MLIYAWPYGSWAYPEELYEMNHKSDDIIPIKLSDEVCYNEIDNHVHLVVEDYL